MIKPTLVVLAAGLGSRFGGLKQTIGFGPHGETLLDYSVFDAIRAGFGRVVFVIRREFADAFRRDIASRFEPHIAVTCVFQERESLPLGPDGAPLVEAGVVAARLKPWGTGQATLAARPAVTEPFGVINADDFYGRGAYQAIAATMAVGSLSLVCPVVAYFESAPPARLVLTHYPAIEVTRPLTADIMARIGYPGWHPEGRFFPDTYRMVRGASATSVLRQAAPAMDRRLAQAWAQRAPHAVVRTPDQALTLASIIEKETGVDSDRALVGGVFNNRLRIGMRLQTDPTVIYGIGSSYDGNIRRSDLTTDTPYNTYTRRGLTPTPIAMPGVDALKAAVNPADGSALYFVAVGDGSGRHIFSTTLAEHNAAVARYLVTRRETLRKAEAP